MGIHEDAMVIHGYTAISMETPRRSMDFMNFHGSPKTVGKITPSVTVSPNMEDKSSGATYLL